MEILFLILYALIGLALIGLILLQQGKGSDMGAAFGSGASSAIFGPVGPGNILARITAVLAALFFAMSLGLAWYAKQSLSPEELQPDNGLEPIELVDDIPASDGPVENEDRLIPLPEPSQ